MRRSTPRDTMLLIAGHLLHLVLILLPSVLLTGTGIGQSSVLLFATLVGGAALIESLLVTPPQKETERDPRALRVAALVGLTILLTFWGAQVERWLTEPTLGPLCWCGVALVMLGAFLRASAIYALGPRFVSDICCDAPPVSAGIYRYLRHPSEIGLLAIAIGGPLVLQAPWSALIAGCVLIPISAWRIRREDKILVQVMS